MVTLRSTARRLTASVALAMSTPAVAQSATEPPSEDIIIYGQPLVEQARETVIRDLQDQGFTDEVDRGDYLLLRNVAAWKGEVRIYDDGWVQMRRQPPQLTSADVPWAEKGSPLAWASCAIVPLNCLKLGGWMLSHRKWTSVEARTLGAIDSEVDAYADRLADATTDAQVNALPARLEGLWLRGEPLTGSGVAVTVDARKAALLAFWDSRTDTPWGDRVREAVEAFLRAEIQSGPNAFSTSELDAFNARRSGSRVLDLGAPNG